MTAVNFNLQDQLNNTPLHDAALQGRVEVTQMLIEAGADVNAKNYADQTSLDLAEQYGQVSVAEVLTAAGATTGGGLAGF